VGVLLVAIGVGLQAPGAGIALAGLLLFLDYLVSTVRRPKI
jgi:hypothetical protein